MKAHPQKPRRLSPWRLQGCQVMNVPIETQRKWKQIASRVMVTTFGSHTWSLRQVLSCDDEDSEDGEEEGETAAAKEIGEISKTHRIEEKYTQRRETTTERSEQKHQKMYQRQKSEKTTSNPKNSRRLQRCQQHPRNQICKEDKD